MNKKLSLAQALQEAGGKKESVSLSKEYQSVDKKNITPPLIRIGKKVIAGHFDPAVSRQLKQMALDHESNVQKLLTEALNDLFEKYNKKPIA